MKYGPGSRRRFLLLTTRDPAGPTGGRAMLSALLEHAMEQIAGVPLAVERLPGRAAWHDGLRGYLNGLNRTRLRQIVHRVGDEAITDVFLDGSNLGGAASVLRRCCPGLRITTFFHNAETRFFQAAWRATPGVRAMAVLAGHWRAEGMAMQASDCRIALCERDSADLARLFGRKADALLPMALTDRWRPDARPVEGEPYALFVGGGFYGNVHGLAWYARTVAPHVGLRTVAVGHGLDAARGRIGDGVELIGAVDDLGPWYAGARLVVAPILSGSGMKTKVAEALMHGKQVVGTQEAFVGYGPQVRDANVRCDDAPTMIAAIRALAAAPPPAFDPAQRALFLRFHASGVLLSGLAAILR